MKYGINLYGILRNRRDTLTALKELRELGFSSVEPWVAPAVFTQVIPLSSPVP